MRDKYKATETPFLTGFESYDKDGYRCNMNFVLSNGDRSKQRDASYPTDYTYMIPKDALNRIRSVDIHYDSSFNCIKGFSFFDKDGALLWKIGRIESLFTKETVVLLGENEMILGVVAKLYPDS